MRQVELVPGVHSSILGFGCAPILGAVDGATARKAIGCALDSGITHFDLARSYGYGEAESFVGKILQTRRNHVTLASKFGIRANWKAKLLRPAKPLIRLLRSGRKQKALEFPVSTPARTGLALVDRFHDRPPLRGRDMRKSVEASLRALRTDYLDLLFLHEPKEAIGDILDLAETASALKREGKIRGWGLALYWEDERCHHQDFDYFDLLQFNNSPGGHHYREVRDQRGTLTNILFSPFRESRDLEPAGVLKRLFADFPRSVVLCSMFNPRHIETNAQEAERSSKP